MMLKTSHMFIGYLYILFHKCLLIDLVLCFLNDNLASMGRLY